MIRISSLLLIIVAALGLNGCTGHMFAPPPRSHSYVLIANQVHPVFIKGLLPKPAPTPDAASAPMPDPLTSDSIKDPLAVATPLGGDPLTVPDPILNGGSAATASSSNKPRTVKNWYWLKGAISHGMVAVKLNGNDIGRFSVRVDTEITDDVDPGSNQITFETEPTVPDQPVSCDLKIVYSQQAEGALPVLEYNTDTDSPDAAINLFAFKTKKRKFGAANQQLPPIQPLDDSFGKTTKVMSFQAD